MRTYKYHATYCITWYASSQFTCLGLPPRCYQEHGQHCAQRSPPDDMSDDIVTQFSSSARKQVRHRFGKLVETFWLSLARSLSRTDEEPKKRCSFPGYCSHVCNLRQETLPSGYVLAVIWLQVWWGVDWWTGDASVVHHSASWTCANTVSCRNMCLPFPMT